jgi:hypothetical protein
VVSDARASLTTVTQGGNRDAMDRDRARDRELTVAGWTPIRATYADLTDGRSRLPGQLVRLGVPGRRSG